MKLSDAFQVLRPDSPSHAAILDAKENFFETYPDARMHAIGKEASRRLYDSDVFWFCDFERHQGSLAILPYAAQIAAMLCLLDRWQIAFLRKNVQFTVQNCAVHAEKLAAVGWRLQKAKNILTWSPSVGDSGATADRPLP